MVKDQIYRNSSLTWETKMETAVRRLTDAKHGARLTLIGKHGFGKSTVLECLAKKHFCVEGDMLYMLYYGWNILKTPTDTLRGVGRQWNVEAWDWYKAPGDRSRYNEAEDWLIRSNLLSGIDFRSNLTRTASGVFLVVPDYKQYVRQLERRTREMLSAEQWKGQSKDRWPVLTWDQFTKWIQSQECDGYLPNIGRDSDSVWLQWAESVIPVYSGRRVKR